MDVIFHKSKKYISEDIDYYMSEQRDMHSMIKPDNNLISRFVLTTVGRVVMNYTIIDSVS